MPVFTACMHVYLCMAQWLLPQSLLLLPRPLLLLPHPLLLLLSLLLLWLGVNAVTGYSLQPAAD